MAEVVRLPEQMLAQMDGAPWVAALEPLATTLPYDLAVAAGEVPASELGKITAPVLILGGKNSPAGSSAQSRSKLLPCPVRS